MFTSSNKHFVRWGIGEVEAAYNGEATYIKNISGIDYAIQIFKNSGTFIVPANVKVIDYTVVGGGGGSAGQNGGGVATSGGGGGYVKNIYVYSVTPGQNISVTIGTGGAGGDYSGAYMYGCDGVSSTFGSTSAAGGKGSSQNPAYGGTGKAGDGGSGGGARYTGLGGRDGADGQTTSDATGGKGQGSTTRGVDGVLYGRGGDGGQRTNRVNDETGRLNGPSNTGQGAGGACPSSGETGYNGGSGIVIVRWLANTNPAIIVTSPSSNETLKTSEIQLRRVA